jgi:hypothetical protein
MANDSDAEDIEVDLRDKNMMLSPEMVVGMTTHLSEESTASTELALSYVIPHHEENKTAPDTVVPIAEAVEEELIEAPSVQKILRFAIPAIGVWLCSPLLSLIDMSAVGLLSGTSQQAALNPAVAVTEYAALLIVCTCVQSVTCAFVNLPTASRFSPGVHVYGNDQLGCFGSGKGPRCGWQASD